MLSLLSANPWRPPNAWWCRAVAINYNSQLRASRGRDSGRGTRWIGQAQRFLHAFEEAEDDQQLEAVIAQYPSIYRARLLFEEAANSTVRTGIEARILARQTNEEIANRMGCSAEIIEAYESLFFNVRSRLGCRDFILTSVLAGAHASGSGDGLKLWGYLGGPHVLDALSGHIPSTGCPSRADEVPAFLQGLTVDLLKMKSATAAMAVPMDGSTQRGLLNILSKLAKVESTTSLDERTQEVLQLGVQLIFESLPFMTLGTSDSEHLPGEGVGPVGPNADASRENG